jgi:G3E family GTPase
MGQTGQEIMHELKPLVAEEQASPPGIVIHQPGVAEPRPAIFAFIWGGKIRPVPALPYGRRSA